MESISVHRPKRGKIAYSTDDSITKLLRTKITTYLTLEHPAYAETASWDGMRPLATFAPECFSRSLGYMLLAYSARAEPSQRSLLDILIRFLPVDRKVAYLLYVNSQHCCRLSKANPQLNRICLPMCGQVLDFVSQLEAIAYVYSSTPSRSSIVCWSNSI